MTPQSRRRNRAQPRRNSTKRAHDIRKWARFAQKHIIYNLTMHHNNIFIISGPSGAGEDSVINGLKKKNPDIHAVTNTTTRKMRAGESEGNPYHFVTVQQFESMIANDELVEWAQHYNGQYYGVTRQSFDNITAEGNIALWKIDYKGVIATKKMFPDIIAIFLMAESLEVLEQRIRQRVDVTEEYIAERMAYTKQWLTHTDIYDYTVINRQGHLDDAIAEVEKIIRTHSNTAT